jgi:hypothetical protein
MVKLNTMDKKDKASGMILRLGAVLLINFLTSQFLGAQAWIPDPGWSYRSPVTVSNPGTATLTNLQVKITLTTSNFDFTKPNSNGSDIRLTESDGVTQIPFWIESWISGSSASIWVKVPSIPPAGTTLFLYYGNAGATSLSSGNGTFDFFDDFESWTVTPYPYVWQDLSASAPIPTPSADLTISVYNNKLYSFGGYGPGHATLNTVYEYDPITTNAWLPRASMPTARWGMVSVEVSGKIYVFGGQDANGFGSAVNEIYDPVSNTWVSNNNGNPLSLPRYEPNSTGVTHPDVIYFPDGTGYDGYHYWMVYTPYPSEAQENPSILRSTDGITWTTTGITNPVIPAGTRGAWNDQENPDPDFIFVPDVDGLGLNHDKWFMVWDGGDSATNSRKIALAWSSDGKTWTQYNGTPVNGNTNPVILSGTDNQGADWEKLFPGSDISKTATSTLFYQGGTFYLFYAEEASGNNRGKIGLATFTWDNTTNSIVNLTRNTGNPIIDLPADAIFKSGGGHINVSKDQGSNTYRMYVVRDSLNSSLTSPSFELSLLTSSSLTGGWTSQGKVIERGAAGQWDEDHIYRSCPVVNSSGEIVLVNNKIRMYYGGVGSQGWRIGIADIDPTTGSVVKYTGGGPQPIPAGISYQGLMGVNYLGKVHLFYGIYHYEYDPVADTYTRKADVPYSTAWGTCAVASVVEGSSAPGNLRIFLIGGWCQNLGCGMGTDHNQVYNPNNDSWEQKTPMPYKRYGATRENPVINGKIYVTHGWNSEGYFFTSNYVYNPVANTWELKGSANHPRDGVACGVINNKLYVVGGRDVFPDTYGLPYNEAYDPGLDTWVPQANPTGWTTSGSNYAFADATAAFPGSYSGSNGLVVRQPMDGSLPEFRYAETVNNFNTIYPHAVDFDLNVTTIGGILTGDYLANPQGIIRLNSNSDYYGNLLFLQGSLLEGNVPLVKWIFGERITLQNGAWDTWHKVNVVCDGVNSRVVFDGTQHSPLSMLTWGDFNIRFGVIKTTQYIDNVRVRKWAGFDPVTLVGIEQNGTLNHWIGTSNSDWNTSSNWSSSSVPILSSNIAIFNASNYPVITASQSVVCNNLTIEPSARVTIETGGTLTVGGTLTINSVGPSNSGSLVVNGTLTATGPVTYNRYMPLGSAWHYVSTPVSLTTDPAGSFWAWDEVAGGWSSGTVTRPVSGRGYTLQAYGTSVAFTGSLVTSDFGITATSPYANPFDGSDYSLRTYATGRNSTTGYGGGGWNLLGNPYTSALNVSAFIDANYNADWHLSKFDPNYVALYLYNGSTYQYVTKNEMGWNLTWPNGDYLNATHIQVGQGFFVLAMNDQVTFNFSRTMQGHNTNVALLKSAKVKYRWPGLQLKAKYGEVENLTTIVFNDDMTAGLDPGYDVGLMSSGSDIEIYTALVEDNGINFALQALPENGSVKNVIPVGLDFDKGGQVIFSADIEPFRNYKFWLEDRLTGILTDLGSNAYTVNLPAKTYGTGRFFVYVAAGRSILPRTNVVSLLDIRIWASNNRQVNIQGSVSEKAICEVFDTWGHKIFETRLVDGDLNSFILSSSKNGVYLVKVTDGIKVVSQKVVLL